MNKKLKQIRILDELINDKILEIENLKTLVTKVNAACEGDRVQSSGSGDKLGDTVAKIVDLQKEINDDIDRFVDLKVECMNYVDYLDDKLLIGILYKRYFQYKTYEQIAEELDVSSRWVQKVHRKWDNSFV